ncbi:VWA domain-containing protein [Lutimaribacter sp. EGI FJ00015]|uniref:VWA domain-containing protein n=1 Tax=Lutimaribacter degradans TaxID=2945989 RepID=A0ACC5ZZ83_9RHOB|nr:VWA domain-containing protein [Lutimaribacter sp. EGI FJ00013]MCM2563612.1 VWA domain-containing protein [Lutimaribacter sp. EGI FJ00013]MCO0614722.1 VWA domain-containing protein [Lutimaribacter sp. EGI FJ00015]MCO0637392.1 VWA domain-containing protein [Lutimaribacter sp. EGI FJ00014]
MAKPLSTALATAFISAMLVTQSHAEAASVIVFDASGSMWAQLEDGETRIEVARDVIADFAAERDADIPIGVVSYGHTRRGDCGDIETVLPVGQHAGGDLAATIGALNPRGKTPLTDAMARARQLLPRTAESADIILITDGLENCGGDPCALAAEFAAEGIDLRAHVVGFALEAEAVQTLSCVPEQTGGQLFTAQSGAELAAALNEVAEVAPVAQDVTLTAVDARNDKTLSGATWKVADGSGGAVFSGQDNGRIALDLMPGDYVADVTAPGFAGDARFTVPERDAPPVEILMEKTQATLYLRARNDETGEPLQGVEWQALNVETEDAVEGMNEEGGYFPLLLPPGDYRIEGSAGLMTGATSVSASLKDDPRIDVAFSAPKVEVELTAPSEVTAGTAFEATVAKADSEKDYLLIAREGSPEETSRYQRMGNRVGGDGTQEFTAPSDPGEYELRYHLARDNSIAARSALTVLPAETRMQAPDQVRPEAEFEVSINGGISGHVVIVSEDRAPDEIVSRYQRMKNSVDGDEGTITRTAPETPGRYLLRYHAGDDQRLLVEQPFVVAE